jgi:S-adenosylmethionine synthetase
MNYPLFSSESVCAGHPDKICDQISDAILDEALSLDKNSRVAVETLVTTNKIVLAGEVTCQKPIDFEKIALGVVTDLGYTDKILNFGNYSPVEVLIHQQSGDIAMGVDAGGAGDQGMMFGYATDETVNKMPLSLVLAHELCRKMDELQKQFKWIRPDGKSQVSVNYDNNRKPVGIEKVVLAKPVDYKNYDNGLEQKEFFYQQVVKPILEKYGYEINIDKLIFNGTGKWEIGGPASDTGVTGRKIVVDTYGGMGRIGGGCFSGKDLTKVDRSAAYAARYIAKNIVANKLASRCEVQIAYAIGYKEPVSKAIDTFGTENTDLKTINDFAWKLMDLSVGGIIEKFDLKRPIYRKTASYGHFGDEEYPWEKTE